MSAGSRRQRLINPSRNPSAGGEGYQSPPMATITGVRVGGQDATATATIANGNVGAVFANGQGGSGYVTPLNVVVGPGGARSNAVPIWAPAGALLSTGDDGPGSRRRRGSVRRNRCQCPRRWPRIQTPYACQVENPNISECPNGAPHSGLAWTIHRSGCFSAQFVNA
jgi:hypothetical protein